MRRELRLLATAVLVGSALVLGGVTAAEAVPQQGVGVSVPAQPYLHNPDTTDWLGSYMVRGQQVFCVRFGLLAPEPNEAYGDPKPLKTKWGNDLPAERAADISFLLLRYGDTKKPEEAAALAHILHSWTAAPGEPNAGTTAPSNTFATIAYDSAFHLNNLPAAAQAAVDRLQKEAATNRGPWTATIDKPTADQIIGKPGAWPVTVLNKAKSGVPNVPVTVTVTDGVLADGKTTGVLQTPGDGGPVAVMVTPTGAHPTVQIDLKGPAQQPSMREAKRPTVQNVVASGGEVPITEKNDTTAKTAPGVVTVSKINEKTQAGISGVSLRLTAVDKVKPAVDQDGKELVGTDGKPTVLVTGSGGTVSVPNLRTPQEVCVIEVSPPPGFDKAFDPDNPPSACGQLSPGATLALTVANKPNAPIVPVTVPAGDQPYATAYGTVTHESSPGKALGVFVIAAGLGGFLVRRRIVGRR